MGGGASIARPGLSSQRSAQLCPQTKIGRKALSPESLTSAPWPGPPLPTLCAMPLLISPLASAPDPQPCPCALSFPAHPMGSDRHREIQLQGGSRLALRPVPIPVPVPSPVHVRHHQCPQFPSRHPTQPLCDRLLPAILYPTNALFSASSAPSASPTPHGTLYVTGLLGCWGGREVDSWARVPLRSAEAVAGGVRGLPGCFPTHSCAPGCD